MQFGKTCTRKFLKDAQTALVLRTHAILNAFQKLTRACFSQIALKTILLHIQTIGRGGGVLFGIRTEIFKSICEIEHNHNLEVGLAEITTFMDSKIIICSSYRPPNADRISWMENFLNFLNDVCSRHSKIILAGDFSLPRARWNACENLSGAVNSI